jgi:hypothetical protein
VFPTLQMAMNKNEIECPMELWEDREGKLSQLENVRSYLHDYLYRPQELFAQLNEFLDRVSPIERRLQPL